MSLSLILAFICLFGWLYLAFFNGKFWLPLLPADAQPPSSWPSVSIIVPARNEADILPQTLPALLAQDYPGAWHVFLVNDHSDDKTAERAKELSAQMPDRLTVIEAPDLPEGWSGKVAAMQAGLSAGQSDYVLFTDADIRHPQDSLRHLVEQALENKLDLVSQMVRLKTLSFAEKLLIPAFVFFFEMLYPFRKAGHPRSTKAAAAGGVMLLRRASLENAGGLAAIKGALIDDCALARLIKEKGGEGDASGRIDLSLSKDITSERPYTSFGEIIHMIARTAFTQLAYSPILLVGTIVGMGLFFIGPVLLPFLIDWRPGSLFYLCWLGMSALYMPTVRYYGLSFIWAFTLPFAALFYLWATLLSALRYWRGAGGQWKGRDQAVKIA